MRLQRQCRRRNDRHGAFALSSTQLGETEISAGLVPAAMSESWWNTKRPRKEQFYQKTFVPFSVSARHGTDVKADQLDNDLMEYAVKPVRPVSLCTDKTLYRFGLLKVELKKENIEKNTPVLSISGRITLHIIVNFSAQRRNLSLSSVQIKRFNVAMSNDTWIQSNNVEANFCFHRISVFGVRFLMVENRFSQDTSQE